MATHVGKVLDGRGVAPTPCWVGDLILVELFLQALSDGDFLYLLLTDPVEHTLLIFLQLMN